MDKILESIFQYFIKKLKTEKKEIGEKWHNEFKFHSHINEILVDKVVTFIGETFEDDAIKLKKEYKKIKEIIDKYAPIDEK